MSPPSVRLPSLVLAGFCLVSASRAAVYTVAPDGTGDFPTIQAAVDASVAGDTVLLLPGVFQDTVTRTLSGTSTRSVVFLKSDVTLTSSGGAAVTTIDGESAHHCVVGENLGPNTVISGITMANGHALSSATGVGWGGGMLAFRSAAVVEDNRFENCAAVGGGAILWWDRFSGGDSAILRRNVFWNNHATDLGGAIEMVSGAYALIENNTFAENRADDRGGAILSNSSGTAVTVSRNIFWSNTAAVGGGALSCIGSSSAGTTGDCNIFWMNTGGTTGDVQACAIVIGMNDNLLADPLFCDATVGNFQLHGDSPGAPGYSGACGLIGAGTVGCIGGQTMRVESRSALPGTSVNLPISLTGLIVPGLSSYEATIAYDPAILTFNSIQTVGTLSDGRLAYANEVTPGTLLLAVAGTAEFSDQGILVDLLFDVSAGATVGDFTALSLNSFTWGEGQVVGDALSGVLRVETPLSVDGTVSYYSGGSMADVVVESGGLTVTRSVTSAGGAYQFGSLSSGSELLISPTIAAGDNGAITSMDAADVLQHLVQIAPFGPLQVTAGDVTGNGTVTVADAGLILEIVAGSAPLPDPLWKASPSFIRIPSLVTDETGQDFAAVLVGDPSGNWAPVGPSPAARAADPGWAAELSEGEGYVDVRVTATRAARAAEVRVESDPDWTVVSRSSPTDGLWRFREEPGLLVAAGAKETEWPEGQELLSVRLPAAAAAGPIRVKVRIEESAPGELVLPLSGPPAAGPLALAVAPVPAAGAITFAVGGPAEPFRIDVFDVTGRRVRRFDGEGAAGGVRVVWDGRDEGGSRVSAGVYFVRLRGAGDTVTKRAVLSR
ncbi:MAG TPA: cohesin domain-containing protein [bacterium]|nr:cohesin domain-containing protein [bacterium]